tara:strand:- start:768 stop:896 length:129 start_codon:yes stop_codon:yes gene_type:complete
MVAQSAEEKLSFGVKKISDTLANSQERKFESAGAGGFQICFF